MKCRWLVGLLLLGLLPITGFAYDNLGSIKIKMAYEGKPVAGGTVAIYDVTDSPEGIDSVEMLVYVKELGIPGTEKQVDPSGFVVFDDLPTGYYLLVQRKAPAGFYPIKPFLVKLPQSTDGTTGNQIEAAPKMEPEQKLPQTGQLIWPAWVLIGLGMSVAGIGVLLWKRE